MFERNSPRPLVLPLYDMHTVHLCTRDRMPRTVLRAIPQRSFGQESIIPSQWLCSSVDISCIVEIRDPLDWSACLSRKMKRQVSLPFTKTRCVEPFEILDNNTDLIPVDLRHPGGTSFSRISHQPTKMSHSSHKGRLSALFGRDVQSSRGHSTLLWCNEALPAQGPRAASDGVLSH